MDYFVANGPVKLKGTFYPRGNKNSVLPILAAVILTDQAVILKNVPEIDDVKVAMKILESLGVKVEKVQKGKYVSS